MRLTSPCLSSGGVSTRMPRVRASLWPSKEKLTSAMPWPFGRGAEGGLGAVRGAAVEDAVLGLHGEASRVVDGGALRRGTSGSPTGRVGDLAGGRRRGGEVAQRRGSDRLCPTGISCENVFQTLEHVKIRPRSTQRSDPMSAEPTAETPFHLQGNFAPVREEVTGTDLPIEGALPPELTGLYVRQSANPVTGTSEHWFMGEGMVHGVRLEAGRAAWYRNRYVKTPYLSNPDVGAHLRHGPDRPDRLEGQHPRAEARRQDPGPRGGLLPLRARRRARDRRLDDYDGEARPPPSPPTRRSAPSPAR